MLFAERSVTGHRLSYVRLLADEALSRGHTVYVALPDRAEESQEFATHLADIADNLFIVPLQELCLQALAELTHAFEITRTVVMDGDSLALAIAKKGCWSGSGRISILIMREYPGQDEFWPRRLLRTWGKRTVIKLAAATPNVDLSVLKSATWRGVSVHSVALDPIVLSCTAADVSRIRDLWQLDSSVYWFGVLGAITERKNVPLIADALASLPNANVGLLVAGRVNSSLQPDLNVAIDKLLAAGKRTLVINATLTDVELDAAVTMADCLILAHSNEGPSGLLGKAALAGTRVVAAGATSLRTDIQLLQDSAEWSSLDVTALREAMRRAATAMPGRPTALPGTRSFINAILPIERTTPDPNVTGIA